MKTVRADPLLAPVVASFTAEHAKNVAIWLGEVFAGPVRYSKDHGGHRTVLERHRNLALTPDQQGRWVELMLETAREVLPNDSETASPLRRLHSVGRSDCPGGFSARVRDRACRTGPKWGWKANEGAGQSAAIARSPRRRPRHRAAAWQGAALDGAEYGWNMIYGELAKSLAKQRSLQ